MRFGAVLYCPLHGAHRILYSAGAIERRDTIAAVVDILEGTQPAFENRSVKYTLHLLPS